MSPSVRLCLRLFVVFALVMLLFSLPDLLGIAGDRDHRMAVYGLVWATAMALLLGGLHVAALRRLLGRWPSARELRPAHTSAVTLGAGSAGAAHLVRGLESALPGTVVVEEDARAGWFHLRLPGNWRTWGTHVEVLLVPAGPGQTVASINARAMGVTLVDYGASLLAARRVAELLRGHEPQPLRASA